MQTILFFTNQFYSKQPLESFQMGRYLIKKILLVQRQIMVW